MGLLWLNAQKPVRVIFNNYNIGDYNGCLPKTIGECKNKINLHVDNTRTLYGIAPGNGLIHRKSFDTILGFDERYVGYGPEDADFNYRICKICKYIELNLEEVNTYHFFHNNCVRDNTNNFKLFNYIREQDKIYNFKIIKSNQIQIPKELLLINEDNMKEIPLM
jgi:predicted glycosyltransferase involved in capsule biosynthesis